MANSIKSARFLIESRLSDAARGDSKACFDLGIVYSSGAEGVAVDLVEAHKWFNIAAVSGSDRAAECRAEISEDMTAREITDAQKAARAWLRGLEMRAA
ncbi:sel1 repeat family protein [Sphingomonas gei]|uniref:Sel1 repeat family protein n=1 Tax=Sphingomonas gei TaxID=1395960 RepID=A0A4S1XAR4_9SPHN|nr:sel1 repeat family protein [Sphingomonas gei]TGX53409.1 sel1 repeat family protein [Sphingomonas gei]